MRRTIMMFVVTGILAAPAVSHAQRVEDVIQRGAKVRVSLAEKATRVGYLDSLTDETIALRMVGAKTGTAPVSISRAQVTRLDVRGTNRVLGAIKGAGIGFLGGAIGGFALGALMYQEEEHCFIWCSRASVGFLGAAFGGLAGIPMGIVGGATAGAGTWERVDPASARIP